MPKRPSDDLYNAEIGREFAPLLESKRAKQQLLDMYNQGKLHVNRVVSYQPNPREQQAIERIREQLNLPADTRVTIRHGLVRGEQPEGGGEPSLIHRMRISFDAPNSVDHYAMVSMEEGETKAFVTVTNRGEEVAELHQAAENHQYPAALLQKLDALPESLATVQWVHPEQDGKVSHIIVQVDEAHANERVRELLGEEAYQAAIKLQTQIASVLTRLGAGSVRVDSMTPDIAQAQHESFAQLKEFKQTADQLAQQTGSRNAEQTEKLLTQLQGHPLADQRLIRALTFLRDYQQLEASITQEAKETAVIALARDGKIRLLGADDPALLAEMQEYVQEHPLAEVDDPTMERLMTARESHFVSTVANGRDRVVYAVWGAGHDLDKEVAAHNRAHPDDLIAIVRVTPRQYAEVQRIMNESEAGEER